LEKFGEDVSEQGGCPWVPASFAVEVWGETSGV